MDSEYYDAKKKSIVLFSDKKDCCGCGACMNICLKQAISMQEDDYGFLYPDIDTSKCVGCEACKKVCSYQNKKETETMGVTYAAVSNDAEILQVSASGGIFATVASEIIKQHGVVFGCSMENHNDVLTPEHIMIRTEEELTKLQGSKYVQSNTGTIYQQVKAELLNGKLVLFSGTPCQVAGLKSFLLNHRYDNLLTMDIICHGVPSADFFKAYIEHFQRKLHGTIKGFKFRDKSAGWGMKGRVDYIDKNGESQSKFVYPKLSSYFNLFLTSDIYRENCYSCKYAGTARAGDITIGDFWGIEKEHPEYLTGGNGNMNIDKGVSCLIINNEHGMRMLEKLGGGIDMKVSTLEKAARGNAQLRNPSKRSNKRDMILKLYKESGYEAVEKWYLNTLGLKKYIYLGWNFIPIGMRLFVKKLI